MANDGNVVLATDGAAASVVGRAVAALGPGTLTLIQNASDDDAFVTCTLPFPVLFNGISYTTVGVGSNGYLTFGFGSSAYAALGPSSPPVPAILICAADRSYQRVYAGTEDGGATYRIRYEGNNTTSGSPGASNVIWEVLFDSAAPSVFKLDITALASEGTGSSGISDGVGPAYIAALTPAANTGYTITFGGGGGNFQVSGIAYTNEANTWTDWRLLIDATGVGTRTFINELEFRKTAGVAEPLANGAISASSNTGGHPPENVIGPNSNENIYWDSGTNTPTFIRYSFIVPRFVREYLIRAIEGTTAPGNFRLQYLVGSTWTTADTRTGETSWGATNPRTFTLATAGSNDGDIVLTSPTLAATGSNPAMNIGAVTLLPYDAAGSGGPSGKFGNVVMPPYDVAGTFVEPVTIINGDVNVGYLGLGTYESPWQVYGEMFAGATPNSYFGDVTLFDIFAGKGISVSAADYPPLQMPIYSVSGTGFSGGVNYADINYSFDVSAVGLVGNVGVGLMSLSLYDAAGAIGITGDAALVPYDVVATGFSGVATSTAGALLEELTVAGTAYSSTISAGDITLPVFTVTAGVTSSSVITGGVVMPKADVKSTLLSGASIAGLIQVPLIQVSARGYSSTIGNATIKIPALVVSGWMNSIAAPLTAADFKTIVMNSRTKAISTYEGLAANSLCEFNGMVLAATADGIVALTGEKDGAADIDAFIRSSVSQYGTQFFKRVINGYIGYRADGKLKVTLYTDETREYSYPLAPRQVATIHPSKVKFGRGVEGRYWQWKIENTDGAGFEIDAYEMDVDVLTRRV